MVDPNGFLGDPAYDLGVALRDRGADLAPGDLAPALGRWAQLLAGPAGIDPVAVQEWALLERVSTGLVALSLGEPALAEPLLRTASVLCGAG
jgi:streptomycin 6-kinase